ncbi:ATP-binding cassette, subfamily B, bacterial [Candidatus Methylobacter favarea]|uniref:ATP-binding cassette, subfamily B, bacterial n=1 Tax=Candidatus Methylobacter favarea TaxID=2707345 RepID=A0A8S0Y6G8_9GAMM|nr:ABC transporter ATP-binding protein [Candidatus Methylobacter favarea]CAA9891353.1 ATP-binding cassette, subfamily B, bacterial [Candidatus Methylobacter favarea]
MEILFKEYSQVIWQRKWFFLIALSALASITFLDLSVPLYYKNIANGLAEPYSETTLATLFENLKFIGFIYAGTWLLWRLVEIVMVPLGAGGANMLGKRCFHVLKNHNYAFFEKNFSGSLIRQVNRFCHSYEIILEWVFFQCFMNILTITISFSIFYRQQREFAFYFLIWTVVFMTWNITYSIWKMRFDKSVAQSDSKLGGVLSDALSNIFIVKSFALEPSEQVNINQASDQVYQTKKTSFKFMFISFAVQGLMTFGMELLLVYLIIQKWKAGNFQVGEFVLFQTVMIILISRLWGFGRNFPLFFSALADAMEMAELFNPTDIETDESHARPLTITKGAINFNNIHFTYCAHPHPKKLFENFCLRVNPGEKVALVGQSGSGKSSLSKLLFRFIEPQQGTVRFDDIAAKDITLSSLRKQISVVPQQSDLFHRSIRDNITLGRDIPDEQLINAARKSHSLEFISSLPDRFETMVGERGVKLSGGEKQRIAIARAFLENAPVVVLDEATSALDSLTEKLIQVAIFDLIKDKTAIVIAHRLSTILHMDRIVVLDHGNIIEQGTHHQLLDLRGKYYAMWQHQSGDFLVE